MSWKTLDDMDLSRKRVLIRGDINVPVVAGQVTDDTRIRRLAPTVADVLNAGGVPVLLAHFGRPQGQVVAGMSLRPLVPALEAAFGADVVFCADCRGPAAEAAIAGAAAGAVILLENTRFYPGEENNDAAFAATLAALGHIYCNDAFSAAHRAHASTEALPRLLPACAGRLMQTELSALEAALGTPARPVVAIVGGAKVSTKLELLGNLIKKVDTLIIGGGMANSFLAARGASVGASLCEHDMSTAAQKIMANADTVGCRILLPRDIVVAAELKANTRNLTVPADACPNDMMILDAGQASVADIAAVLDAAGTLIWNGPLGAFEIEPFNAATNAAAGAAAACTRAGTLVSIAGGGDTAAALNQAGVAGDFTYISTAGGAFLEWMEGKTLPGVAALASA